MSVIFVMDYLTNKTSFSKTYLKGEFSYGFWNFLARGLGAANSFLIILSLSLYEYGSFQLMLVSYAGVATFLSIGGGAVRNDILRFEAEGRGHDAKKLFLESLLLRIATAIVLGAGVFFFVPLLAYKFDADNIYLIKLFSLLFFHDALLASVVTVIEMRKKFNVIASRVSIAKITQLAVLLYFFFFQEIDLLAVVISILISSFFTLALLLPAFLESYAPWKKIKQSSQNLLFAILTSYGKWELLQPLLGKVLSFFEPWAIKLFISTEAVAVFSIAQTLLNTIAGFFPAKTFSTLIPFEAQNEERMKKIYTYSVKYLIVFSVCIGIGSLLGVPVLIKLFFEKYTLSLPYFYALLPTLPILAVSLISSHFLTTLRRQKFMFFQKSLKVTVAIPLYLLLLPIFGLWGLVIHNYLLTLFMMTSLFVYFEKMKPKLYVRWRDVLHFDNDDRIFLRNIFVDLKKIIKNKISRIKISG